MTYKKKSYKKFVATAATATLVASAIVPAVSAASFPDVEETHEFATYINAAVDAGYIKGYADGTFGINDNLKRSQVVIIIGRYLEKLGYTSEATTSPWSDVTDAEVIKYGNIVKDAGVFTGYTDGTLNGAGLITRENMAVVLDRLAKTVTGTSLSEVAKDIEDVKVADLATANADYQASIQALRDLEISTADNFNPKGNLKRGQFAKFIMNAVEKIDAIGQEATEVAIESVKAINAKTLEVTFAGAVEDTSKAVFAVKKGVSTLVPSISWNEEKTVAYLELSGKLTAGKYDVTVTGLSEEALTGSVEVENEKVSKINITSQTALINDAGTGVVVTYEILNQYGEDVTKSTLANNISFTSPQAGSITSPTGANRGTVVIPKAGVKANDVITLVIVDNNTGVNTSATLTVVEKASVDTITLGEVYNAKGLTLSEDNKTGFYILVDAKDQYGNAVTDAKKVNDALTLISSNELVVAKAAVESIEVDGKNVLAIPVVTTKAGTATLTAVSKNTGKSTQTTVTVAPGVKVDSVTIGDAEGTISGGKEILLPVEVLNTLGEQVTKTEKLSGIKPSEGKFVEKDGKLFIQLTTPTVTKADGQKVVVVSVTSETGKVATKVLTVKPNAEATELVGLDSKVSLTVLSGQNLVINDKDFIVYDQYGDRITDASKYEITAVLADGTTINSASDKVTIPSLAKSQTVTFKLQGVTPETSIEKKVTVVSVSEFTSYEVTTDLGTVYAPEGGATTGDYLKTLKVTGVTANGQKVELPSNSTDYTVENGSILTYDAATGKVGAKAGHGLVATATEGKKVSTTDKLTVIINATGEVIEVNATVTAEAPKATNILVTEDGTKTADVISTVTETNGTLDQEDIKSHLYVTDQYGVEFTDKTDLRLTFTSLSDVNAKGAVISGNGTKASAINFFGKEDTVNVKITLGGATADVTAKGTVDYVDNVKVTKAYKPTVDGNGTDGSNLDKYEVSFSASTNTITIKETAALDSITSASSQGKAKWVGILVDLDATLTDVSFSKDNSSYTVLDASEQAAAEAVGGTKANTLVYWINTDDAFDAQGNAKFYLKSSNSIKPLQVNVKFEKLN